jgi:NAD(P)H-hydrate epimerase
VDQIAIETFHIPGLILMENAGRNCAEQLLSRCNSNQLSDQAVVVLCGPGNNGGDGFVLARHLYNAGLNVKVVLLGPSGNYVGDALTNLKSLSRLRLTQIEFDPKWTMDQAKAEFMEVNGIPTTWLVDAMLGTGAKGEPRAPMDRAIELANSMDVRSMAVDIPSGLDCDTGIRSKFTFHADVTCTFIDRKIGFDNATATAWLGEVLVIDIGAPPEILELVLVSD